MRNVYRGHVIKKLYPEKDYIYYIENMPRRVEDDRYYIIQEVKLYYGEKRLLVLSEVTIVNEI